jgi:hypothetical protein
MKALIRIEVVVIVEPTLLELAITVLLLRLSA